MPNETWNFDDAVVLLLSEVRLLSYNMTIAACPN